MYERPPPSRPRPHRRMKTPEFSTKELKGISTLLGVGWFLVTSAVRFSLNTWSSTQGAQAIKQLSSFSDLVAVEVNNKLSKIEELDDE